MAPADATTDCRAAAPGRRAPAAGLRPFVEALWAFAEPGAGEPAAGGSDRLEHVLPSGALHVVVRLSDAPVRVLASGRDGDWQVLRHGIVGGARSSYYVRALGEPATSVGAVLRPGAAPLLFGVGADELAERHTPLADLLGAQAGELCERLGEARDHAARLLVLEAFLAARLPVRRGVDPSVARWLEAVHPSRPVATAVQASGLSHRQFIANFRRAFGLAPKTYQRVRRFQQVLHALHADPAASLADLAQQAGYSDQAHLQREFAAMAGVTPGEYRRRAPPRINHLPAAAAAPTPSQFRSRRGGPALPE